MSKIWTAWASSLRRSKPRFPSRYDGVWRKSAHVLLNILAAWRRPARNPVERTDSIPPAPRCRADCRKALIYEHFSMAGAVVDQRSLVTVTT